MLVKSDLKEPGLRDLRFGSFQGSVMYILEGGSFEGPHPAEDGPESANTGALTIRIGF